MTFKSHSYSILLVSFVPNLACVSKFNMFEMLVLYQKVVFFISSPPPPPMFVCHICLVSLTPPPLVLSKCHLLFFSTVLSPYFCHVLVHFSVVLLSFSVPFLATWYYFSCHPDRSSFPSLLFLFLRHVRFLFL